VERRHQVEINDDIILTRFSEIYMEHIVNVKSPGTQNRERRVLRLFTKFTGDIPLKAIDRSLIDKYISHRLEQPSMRNDTPVSKSTVNLEIRHLKAIFNTALSWNNVKTNPFRGVKMLRVPQNPRPKFLDTDQIILVREAFKNHEMQNLVDYYLWTGVRLNEALQLTRDDIDFKEHLITIRSEFAKSRKYRYIAFEPDGNLGRMLKGLRPRKDGKIFGPFNSKGKELPQWKYDWVGRSISRVCESIGLGWVTTHTFRHTFASHLVMAGVPLYTVKELLGHSTMKTTEIYAHLAKGHTTEMVSRLPY
jgi:integrase